MTRMNKRKKALEALLGFEHPIEQHKTELAEFSWDSETEIVFLSSEHLTNILNRYLNGATTAIEVESWANAIEGRDDIGFQSKKESLRQVVHELANPLVTQPLTFQRAKELLTIIETASANEP